MHIAMKARGALIGLAVGALISAAPAYASGGGTAVMKAVICSNGSSWKLKAKPDNSQLEVSFEVDSNVVGQQWSVRLLDNGAAFFSGRRTTVAPSGSFSVRRFTADNAGTDTIV